MSFSQSCVQRSKSDVRASKITETEWNDVSAAVIGLIRSRRKDGVTRVSSFHSSHHYLDVRAPSQLMLVPKPTMESI